MNDKQEKTTKRTLAQMGGRLDRLEHRFTPPTIRLLSIF